MSLAVAVTAVAPEALVTPATPVVVMRPLYENHHPQMEATALLNTS